MQRGYFSLLLVISPEHTSIIQSSSYTFLRELCYQEVACTFLLQGVKRVSLQGISSLYMFIISAQGISQSWYQQIYQSAGSVSVNIVDNIKTSVNDYIEHNTSRTPDTEIP